MKYFDIPDKEFEELCNTEVDDLEFSVRTYNVLKRCGCETLADVAYLTVEEIQTAKNASQRALGEVQEKLAERNVSLMTQEEKQQILDGTDNPMVLRRQIMVFLPSSPLLPQLVPAWVWAILLVWLLPFSWVVLALYSGCGSLPLLVRHQPL